MICLTWRRTPTCCRGRHSCRHMDSGDQTSVHSDYTVDNV